MKREPSEPQQRPGASSALALVGVCVVSGIAAVTLMVQTGSEGRRQKSRLEPESSREQSSASSKASDAFPTTIRQPIGPPTVPTGMMDPDGNAISVACSTCHTTRKPDIENQTPSDLTEFHAGMQFSHGKVSCLACHNSTDYDALKLADGTRVEFTNVMTLCAQCHGPQMTDYEHGAHGGMNGFWDTTRGPRQKNNCVDCHNPHMPQFPKMRPTFKPRDRFLDNQKAEAAH